MKIARAGVTRDHMLDKVGARRLCDKSAFQVVLRREILSLLRARSCNFLRAWSCMISSKVSDEIQGFLGDCGTTFVAN
eukprot:2756675-Prorocentrum_lima.AAC.1